MKTTVEALKDYYVEMGGSVEDVAEIVTIPDMIAAITTLGGGGGSTSNNFIIEASIEGDLPWPDEGISITIDKTSEEITTALNAGKNLFVKFNFDETSSYGNYEYWLIPFNRRTVKRAGADRGENKVSFACTLAGTSNTGYMEITINLDDDTAYVDTRNFTDDWGK